MPGLKEPVFPMFLQKISMFVSEKFQTSKVLIFFSIGEAERKKWAVRKQRLTGSSNNLLKNTLYSHKFLANRHLKHKKMKKLNLLLAVMAVTVLASCGNSAVTGSVKMNDVKDTISYSIGMGRAVRVWRDQLPDEILDDPAALKSFVEGFADAAKDPENVKKLAYAVGYEFGSREMSQAYVGLSDVLFGGNETFNKDNYVRGLSDGILENWDIMTFEEADETSNRLYEYLSQKQFDEYREANTEFLENKANEENVFKTESGMLYEVVKLGNGGPKPTATSDVEVRYRGELIDGKVFDETEDPISLNLSGVIEGWTEGLQLMSVGDKYRFYIPYNLGYGEQGYGNVIKPYSTLVFDVELVSIK